nr:unnamed protein product [Spirometra erinaceieuropaei]
MKDFIQGTFVLEDRSTSTQRITRSEPDFFQPTREEEEISIIAAVLIPGETFQEELLSLEESTSPDPDKIPANLLKELVSEMAKSPTLLLQSSLVTGCLPFDYYKPIIYRSASLASICRNIMEKIIKKSLIQFLKQNDLSDDQQDFHHGKGCGMHLLFSIERWTKTRNEDTMVHAIYMDPKKPSAAFYTNASSKNRAA